MEKVFVKKVWNEDGDMEDQFQVIENPTKLQEKEIQFKGYRLASINDLIIDICNNGEPIKGLLEVKEGLYTWSESVITGDEFGLDDEVESSYIQIE